MTTATRGLIRYEGQAHAGDSDRGDDWQEHVDQAASFLAAAALKVGMMRSSTVGERQLSRYLADQAARKRRTTAAKLAVITLGVSLAVLTGCYIGTLV
jgi:hypothetical protein